MRWNAAILAGLLTLPLTHGPSSHAGGFAFAGDKAGRDASRKIADQLCTHLPVEIVKVPEGKQPDQLGTSELQRLLRLESARTGTTHQALPKPTPIAAPGAPGKKTRGY